MRKMHTLVAAVQGQCQFTFRWLINLYGGVGAGSANLTWQILAGLNYRVTQSVSFVLGYRYLAFDSWASGLSANIAMQGSCLGLNLHWVGVLRNGTPTLSHRRGNPETTVCGSPPFNIASLLLY